MKHCFSLGPFLKYYISLNNLVFENNYETKIAVKYFIMYYLMIFIANFSFSKGQFLLLVKLVVHPETLCVVERDMGLE